MSNSRSTQFFSDAIRVEAFARTLPFAAFIAMLAVRGALAVWPIDLGSFDPRWLYALQATLACLALLMLSRRYLELARPAHLQALPLMASVATGVAVLALWIAPMPPWGQLGEASASFVPVDPDGSLRWDLIVARTFGAALVVPIMEELFWRSFLMRWIDKRDFLALSPGAVSGVAVLISSFVFALAHTLWLAAFLAGIAYALLYRYTRSLWYPIVAHASTNALLAVWVVSQHAWGYW